MIALGSLPQVIPTGIVGGLLAAVTVGVIAWRRFRSGQVVDWSTLLERYGAALDLKDREHTARVAELKEELAAAREQIKELRTREAASYDRAEMFRRALVRDEMPVPGVPHE